jgi:hypothetical protein
MLRASAKSIAVGRPGARYTHLLDYLGRSDARNARYQLVSGIFGYLLE